MDLFVPVLYDPEPTHRRRRYNPFREIFEPFERAMTPWFHTPHFFDPFDTVAVHTPWRRTFVGSQDEPRTPEHDAIKGEIKDTWETALSLKGFDRDNVKVTALNDHSVLVEAKKVNVDEEGGQYEYQHLCRKLAVPENVDMNALKVDFSDDGKMVLKAGPPQLTSGPMDTSEQQAQAAPSAADGTGDAKAVAQTTQHPLANLAEGDKDFDVKFNLKGYPPDSIKVKVSGNRLSVHAKEEVKTENGIVHRQFHQAMTIPRHVNPDNIVSSLSADGQLSIKAKKEEEREVDIKLE